MSDLLSGLNDEQRAAVTLPPAHALVLAGAGSGKTRVLTTRAAWLIHNRQSTLHNILAVTFTNKAAREMLARMEVMLPLGGQGARRMWIGTFHGISHRLLRLHHRQAGLEATFQILDQADQLSAIKRMLKALGIAAEALPPKQLQNAINRYKEAGLRPEQALEEAENAFERQNCALYEQYHNQCKREQVIDFAELLLASYELLQHNDDLRQHYQERFRHILVDEFQDTNILQYQWLKLFCGAQNHLFCVGDDDQSIYSFRGANVANMYDFETEYKVEHVIRLERNYRSGGNILAAANAIIANNQKRLGKNLWTASGEGETVRVFEAMSDNEEADWIVDEIKSLANDGHPYDEIALLYRSNAQSRVLEHALFSNAITYRVYGGLRFFDRQEIKHALAYLRLVANPDDDNALLRVINFPPRGIGTRTLEMLQQYARDNACSLYAASAFLPVAARARSALNAFSQLIENLRQRCTNLALIEVLAETLRDSGLLTHYENDKEGEDRLANLEELSSALLAFLREYPQFTEPAEQLNHFLAHAALEAGENLAENNDAAVQLMTVHAAKGLEFDHVFLSGLEEGLFPHMNSIGGAAEVEEERRLMYVAVTRARKRLHLSFAQSRILHGQAQYGVASRFLAEIPPALLSFSSADGRMQYQRAAEETHFATRTTTQATSSHGFAAQEKTTKQSKNWNSGDLIAHKSFGTGVIIAQSGSGEQEKIQVNFGDQGVKWLNISAAKPYLSRIE